MNMMRNKNRNNNNRNNRGGGGQRRYNNNSGGNRGGQNDGQNLQRQKHHATQMREKYNNMVRDAQNNGDRVDVEYYLQHVDHYNRVLADIAVIEAERFAAQREAQIIPGGPNDPNAAQYQAENADATGDANANASNGGGEEFQASNQPRMTRHPRRPYHPHAGEGQAAQGGEAQSNEIPLPGSILPPI